MRTPTLEMIVGAELPDTEIFWYADPTTLVDFSANDLAWSLKVVDDTGTTAFTKVAGIVGAAGNIAASTPNVTIAWATTGELNSLEGGRTYTAQLTCTRGSDGKSRSRQFLLRAIGAL